MEDPMRIAFVSGNRETLPDAVTPLGLLYVIASTPLRHETLLIDLCFTRHPQEELRQRLISFRPDLIALGMRNIQKNDYSGVADNIGYYASLIATCRSVTDVPLVLGGSGFSVMPHKLMDRLRPDYGISGEAERSFPRLVAQIERGESDPSPIGGLHFFSGDQLKSFAPHPQFVEMDELPKPDRTLVDGRYYERYGIESIQTKRGCPLKCDYCTYPLIEGRIGRTRDPTAVVDEMFAALEQQPAIKHFFIVDSVFNLPKSHAKAVCRELAARRWKVPWTCYANPLGFDPEFAGLAREAGCAGMEIGSDSGCDDILDRLRKGFSVEHIRRIHAICREAGLPDCHTFILGTPGETMDHVHRTLDFIVDLDPFSAIIMMWIDDYESLDSQLRTRHMELRERISDVLLARKDQYPHWSIPPLGVNFDHDLFRRLRRRGYHGPLWQHMRAG